MIAWHIVRTVLLIIALAFTLFVASNCTMLTLNYASLETDNKPDAKPEIMAATLDEWQAQIEPTRAAFVDHVYGPWPTGLPVSFGEPRIVDPDYLGRGVLEEVKITVGEGPGARSFHMGVAYPASTNATAAPIVIGQTFSSNCATFNGAPLTAPDGGLCDGPPNVPGIFTYILGEFIAVAPVDQYLERGYAFASFYSSEFVPDRKEEGRAVLAGLTGGDAVPTSALAAWAYAFSAAIDYFDEDDRIDPERTAVYGHSRFGKVALVAGAWDNRIEAVLAHQSGFGGASLSRSTVGEGLKRIFRSYPHWFDPAYGEYAGRLKELPVDQHQLLALIAPTPVLLGNGRRDVWSDPNSSYRAAEAADRIYELYGVRGLDQDGLRDFNPNAELAFHMRAGAHGVQQEDIDAFLDFMDGAFGRSSLQTATVD